MGVGGQRHAPAALPLGNTRYPLYKSLGGPQGRFGRMRKISPSPGFDPRTVQPVASRYTDWAFSVMVWMSRPPFSYMSEFLRLLTMQHAVSTDIKLKSELRLHHYMAANR